MRTSLIAAALAALAASLCLASEWKEQPPRDTNAPPAKAPQTARPAQERHLPSAAESNTLEHVFSAIDRTAAHFHSFKAAFKQFDTDPIFQEENESSGVFHFRKVGGDGDGAATFQLRFDYVTPEPSTFIINGSKIIQYDPTMKAPQESLLVDNVKLDAMLAGFTSTKRMREHYDVMLDKAARDSVTLFMMPKKTVVDKNFRELRVTFSRGAWLPVKIDQLKLNGQRITFTFDTPEVNRTLPDKLFTREGIAVAK
ncbi:outer membrane lipoprotein carrier protein LolA [bacterium]|nr:outer membrane lipoprotein carrier protein LolA [bacterium]